MMTTADELLRSLTNSNDGRTLVIDNDLRTINIPNAVTALGVEADDDVHRLDFQMPRYYTGTDLSEFSIRINYLNANNEGDIYYVDPVTNRTVADSEITFSWLVGPNALRYKGNVNFIVCLKEVDNDGNVLREFNTTVATLPVLEGLEVDAAPAEGEISDLLAQLSILQNDTFETLKNDTISAVEQAGVTQVQNVKDESTTQQENIVKKGEEVLTTIGMVRSRANAIAKTAEGETVTLADSSDDYLRGLNLYGKSTQVTTTGIELFNAYAERNESFAKATVENNGAKITVTGAYYVSWPITLKGGDNYYINFTASGDTEYRAVRFEYSDKEITDVITNPQEFTPSHDIVSVYLYAGLGTEGTVVYENFRIRQTGEIGISTPWEPYSGGIPSPNPEYPQDIVSIDGINVYAYGKNLVRTNYDGTKTYEGLDISFTKGSAEVHLNGTTTKSYAYAMSHGTYLTPGRYTMSVWGLNTVSATHDNAYLMNVDTREVICDNVKTGSPVTFDVTASGTYRIDFVFANGTTYNNATVRFQIEAGDMATDYEPIADRQDFGISHTLPGIPVTSGGNYTDANGQQWICDEIDFENGKYIQRVGQMSLTTDRAYYYNTDTAGKEFFYTAENNNAKPWETRLYCSHFPAIGGSVGMDSDYWMQFSGSGGIRFRHKDLTSLSTLTTWLSENSVFVCYVLATPIEHDLTDDELTAFALLHSNYPVTTVMNDAGAWMNIKYNTDTKTYVDEKTASSGSSLPIKVLYLKRYTTTGEITGSMTPSEVYDAIWRSGCLVLYTYASCELDFWTDGNEEGYSERVLSIYSGFCSVDEGGAIMTYGSIGGYDGYADWSELY